MRTISMLLSLVVICQGCGTWVANPKQPKDDTEKSPQAYAESGEAMIQQMTLEAGKAFTTSLGLTTSLHLDDAKNDLELILVDSAGIERSYVRKGQIDPSIAFTPEESGEYTLIVKNNGESRLDVESLTQEGLTGAGSLLNTKDRTDPFKDVVLKAFVSFSSVCKRNSDDGNSTVSVTAPSGEYFIQPFVFLGKVGEDGKVAAVDTATITVSSADRSVTLSRLSDFPLSVYKELGLSEAEHEAYTRTFYQGYFGGSGEMYTTDIFRFGGDCENATTFPVDKDPGMTTFELLVEDTALGLSKSMQIRPTESVSFSTYEREGDKLTDYTQCTYNRLTGEPTTYNGTAEECKSFSYTNPPYVMLDYLLPSDMETGGFTTVSDPTRIIFYGHSYPREWYAKLIESSADLRSGAKDSITLTGCLNNGGLVSVPISTDKTYMPLKEFNTAAGDVVNLARKTGSYTALADFYQGNVDASGEVTYTTCVPDGQTECASMETITVVMEDCKVKADSGVSVTSLGSAFVYPSYFEMSGVIEE